METLHIKHKNMIWNSKGKKKRQNAGKFERSPKILLTQFCRTQFYHFGNGGFGT